jgi:hypothetical protein
LKNKFNNLDIPITIYTPIDVKKDKMVVHFHGGGKKNKVFFCLVNLKKYDLGWTIGSRKTHQTIVNMLAE